jgi:predicted nucleic acid-binding protein
LRALTGVLDANTVIGLAKGGVFSLLSSLYADLYVPPAVIEEVIGQGPGLAGGQELARALGAWVTEVVPDAQVLQQFSPQLSSADREVLAVAQTRAIDHVLSADRHICREAIARMERRRPLALHRAHTTEASLPPSTYRVIPVT